MRVNSDQIVEGPAWQPTVWHTPPEALVDIARADLFNEQRTIDGTLRTAAGGGYPDTFGGSGTAPTNEGEQLMSASPGPTSTVAGEWNKCMSDLRGGEDPATDPVNPTHVK